MEQNKNILVLDGNSSQCLPLIRAFYRDGHRVSLVCPGICSSGYFSRYVNKRLVWPRITGNEEEFYQIFLNHIQKKDYDLVLGLSDVSTAMLAYYKSDIEKYVQTIVPDYEVYEQAADKYLTMQLCMRNKIPCPLTFSDREISEESFKEKLKYPIVIKPKKGVGSVGFTIVPDRMSLLNQLPSLKEKYGSLLIQEYIPNQTQYTAEVICDHKSEVKVCVISEKKRFFPVRGGTSCCNETINSPEIRQITTKLLKAIEWTGVANVDFILDPRDNTPKVIEINPRIGATAKIAFLVGVNFSRMFLSLSSREKISPVTEYKKGTVMRNLLLDLFWFLFSSMKQKRKTRPAYFNFMGRNIYYQSFRLDDPAPFFGFVMEYLVKYSNIKKLRNKIGRGKMITNSPKKAFDKQTTQLLWTGGWDSTFRLLQLLYIEKKEVQPIYIIDFKYKSPFHELMTMNEIRNELKHEEIDELLKPTIYYNRSEIEIDDEVLKAWENINTKRHLGIQYVWFASFCRQFHLDGVELSVEKQEYNIGDSTAYNLHESRLTEGDKVIFKYFSLPLLHLTKKEMRKIAADENWMNIMELTWFCHHPIYHPFKKGVPCGICNPCRIAVNEGFGDRIPFVLRYSGKYLKKIYNSSIMNHLKKRIHK